MIYPNDVMNEVLRDEIGCDLFKNYLKTIYCSETLQFWTEIEAFKANAPPPTTVNQGALLAFSSTPIESSSSSSNTAANNNNSNNNGGCFSSSASPSTNNNSKDNKSSGKYLSQTELHEQAQNLFDRFLENGSEFELNIDALSREVVRGKLAEDIDSSLFDDVQKVVYESLWMDCFPPFTHTLAYNRYKQDTGKCHLPEFLRISFKRKSPKKDDNVRMKPISSK